ncbi:MAG: hypothetical protein KKB25_03630 [Nanoarchaeota archaeon]|nr:hypothetical protein [Nanoarchaeota archaeon]
MSENEVTFITDFELQEDLMDAIKNNKDIIFDDLNVKKQIEEKDIGTLLEVEKKIGSSTTIISVKEVNEELLSSAFV